VLNIETYNRVPSLASLLLKRSIAVVYSLLLLAILGSIASIPLNPSTVTYAVIIIIGSTASFLILFKLNNSRTLRCRFCHGPLEYVIRPFFLNSKYLGMEGTKQGDYFFTLCRWGLQPWHKRWAKISRCSLACHHCKLTEERVIEHYDNVTETELRKINNYVI
jgi:hypothetical protein